MEAHWGHRYVSNHSSQPCPRGRGAVRLHPALGQCEAAWINAFPDSMAGVHGFCLLAGFADGGVADAAPA